MSENLPNRTLPVSKAASFLGVSAETLRRWDRKGILKPFRTKGGQRRYSLTNLEAYKSGERSAKTPLKISQAAEQLGVHPETLRRWERDGAIKSQRTNGGQRRYSVQDLEKISSPDSQEPSPPFPVPPLPAVASPGAANVVLPPALPRLPIPVRAMEHYRPRPRKTLARIVVSVFGIIFALFIWSKVSPLTKMRLYRAFLPSVAVPIVDVGDVMEYKLGESFEILGLRFKSPVDLLGLVTQTLTVLGDSVMNGTRFLGKVFFGSDNDYFITPAGDASFNSITGNEGEVTNLSVVNLTVTGQSTGTGGGGGGPTEGGDADTLGGQAGNYYLDLDNETGTCTDCLTTAEIDESTLTISLSDANTLDGIDSTQFLRSDTSDSFTSGTLTFNLGTTVDVNGSLQLPAAGISGAGAGSGLDADLLDGQSGAYYLDFPGFTDLFTDYGFTDNSANWDTAYGWGNHALVGYLTDITGEPIGDLADVTITLAETGDYLRFGGADWVDVGISQVLTDLLTVDGSGSSLDADTLDGQDTGYFLDLDNETGTCADCLTTTEIDESTFTGLNATNIDDIYLFNTGDIGTGTYTFEDDVTLGLTFADSLIVNAAVASDIIPIDSLQDLGSAGLRWFHIFADEINATTIVGTVSGGETTSADWRINSDNPTADLQDSTITFDRGTESPNGVLRWDSAADQYLFETFPLALDGQLISGVTTGTAPLTVSSTTLVANLNTDLLDDQEGTYYLDLDNETGTCTDCLSTTEIDESTFTGLNAANIDDIYLLNSGDTATGDYNFDANTLVIDSAADNVGIGDATPDGKLDVEPIGAVTASTYGINLSNLVTNVTTDGINKYGAYITSTGGFGGGGGAATSNWGLYVDTISGADLNYGAYFADGVGIGTTSPVSHLEVSSSSTSFPRGITSTQTTDDTIGANIGFRKSRGATGAILTNDVMGALSWAGYDGAAFSGSQATIRVYAAENWSGSAKGTYMRFQTTANTTTTAQDRMTIDHNGNVGIGDTSPAALFTVGSSDLFQIASTGDLTTSNGGTWTFSNDTNFALSGGVNGLSFDTSTLSIDALNHRVGIGTTSIPTGFVLDIDGSVRLRNATATRYRSDWSVAAGGLNINAFDDTGGVYIPFRLDGLSFAMRADASDAKSLTLANSGDVGIGDASPEAFLDLEKSGAAHTDLQIDNTNAGDFDPRIQFDLGGTDVFTIGVDDSDSDKFKIGTTALETGTAFTIDSAGNVGIGETSPASKLEVRQSSTGTGFGGTNGTGAIRVSFATGYGVGIDTWDGGVPRWGILNYNGDTSTVMMEGTYNSTNVIFNAGGNVGIGTTGPNAKLSIANNVATGFLDNYSEYQAILYDGGSATSSYGFGIKSNTMVFNSGASYSFDRTGSATSMVIDSSGNVGIGTTSPGNRLHSLTTASGYPLRLQNNFTDTTEYWNVGPADSDNFAVFRDTDSAGMYIVYGAQVWTANSDLRLKTNIRGLPSDKGLSALMQLNPVNYNWLNVNSLQTTQTGFVAQEVQQIFPELVSIGETTTITLADGSQQTITDPLGISLESFIPYIVKGIQEQQGQIAALSAELKELEMKIDGSGDAAQTNPDGSTTKITSQTVEAGEGFFEKLTATILGTFEKLIAKTAEIVSAFVKDLTVDRLTVTDKTSGQVAIPAGSDKLTVNNSQVAKTSKVFVTFRDTYAPATNYWVSAVVAGESFTVTLDQPTFADSRFDYWIVN